MKLKREGKDLWDLIEQVARRHHGVGEDYLLTKVDLGEVQSLPDGLCEYRLSNRQQQHHFLGFLSYDPYVTIKKKVVKMFRIHDTLFMSPEKAQVAEDGKETIKQVYVGVDEDVEPMLHQPCGIHGDIFFSHDYFGSWVFSSREEAEEQVNQYNEE